MHVQPVSLILIAVASLFAWSMGAHYTGACMGMPFASGSIRLWPALVLMGVLTLVGATVASHGVEATVGHAIIESARVTPVAAVVVVAAAFLLTTAYTRLRVPTSTIQILVFSIVGTGLGAGLPIDWRTIARLAVLWISAPLAAFALGYVFTHAIDRIDPGARAQGSGRGFLPTFLVLVGAAASFTLGANDVSNATGVFLMTHLLGALAAGFIGGLGMTLGVLTWGRPLLQTVGFDIVRVDLAMATAAQSVQALVVLAAVAFGYFTSMNQALIGAMAGTGYARGRQTVQWPAVRGILWGWLLGPATGLLLSYAIARGVALFTPV